jgi:CheY-like chemotaxis protein
MKASFAVLLVEDNPDDAFFMQRAFEMAHVEHPLAIVPDGQQAIAYMRGSAPYTDRIVHPLPRLVIADLKIPGVSGFDLFQWMRQDAYARLVPIIILSSSALSNDVNTAYALGANAYMVKPADPPALERLLRSVAEFWTGEPPVLPSSNQFPSSFPGQPESERRGSDAP